LHSNRVDPFLMQCRAHEGKVLLDVAITVAELQIQQGIL
jgi:hypothetical protein